MKLPRKYFNEAEMIESFPEISLTLATEAKLPIFNSTTSSFVIIILLHTGVACKVAVHCVTSGA